MVEARGAGPDFPGREFGPYTIVRRLGIGGMAETFEAIRHGTEGFAQRVCLKLALPFLREDKAFVQLFQREARLAAKLRHGNIVGVLDYGSVDGTPYMALELVDGVDLQRLLEGKQRLSAEHVALIAIELAKGLSHAHDPPLDLGDSSSQIGGIVHRDLSPSNVMLSQQGEVLLTDFGVAKAISGASRHQSAVKGKVPYMSPEQLRNDPLDGRSDLFSLGVVLYECLSGSRPYFLEGECLDQNGYSFLALTPQADPSDPRADTIKGEREPLVEGWGTHLIDATAAMGDILNLIEKQAASWAAIR